MVDPDAGLWFNGKLLHGKCLAQYRREVGVASKTCAYCRGIIWKGSGTTDMDRAVHMECLDALKELDQQDEADPHAELPVFF